MLDQVVSGRTVVHNVSKNATDGAQLVVAGKDNRFAAFLSPGCLVHAFLGLDEDELGDQLDKGVGCQDLFPHVRDRIVVLAGWVAFACVDAFTAAHVEGQEEGLLLVEFGGHVDLVEVHREVDQGPGLEQEQTALRVAFLAVLPHRVLNGLSGRIALELKTDNRQTIEADDQVNPFFLFISRPRLLNDCEAIRPVLPGQLGIEARCGLRVHQGHRAIRQLNAPLENREQTAATLGHFIVDRPKDGFLKILLVDLRKRLNRVLLRLGEELHQDAGINHVPAIKIRIVTLTVTMACLELSNDELLIVPLSENLPHRTGTSFLPVTDS